MQEQESVLFEVIDGSLKEATPEKRLGSIKAEERIKRADTVRLSFWGTWTPPRPGVLKEAKIARRLGEKDRPAYWL